MTTGKHKHYSEDIGEVQHGGNGNGGAGVASMGHQSGSVINDGYASAGNTGTASPYTETLGRGTPISINPEHITVKAWKRLT